LASLGLTTEVMGRDLEAVGFWTSFDTFNFVFASSSSELLSSELEASFLFNELVAVDLPATVFVFAAGLVADGVEVADLETFTVFFFMDLSFSEEELSSDELESVGFLAAEAEPAADGLTADVGLAVRVAAAFATFFSSSDELLSSEELDCLFFFVAEPFVNLAASVFMAAVAGTAVLVNKGLAGTTSSSDELSSSELAPTAAFFVATLDDAGNFLPTPFVATAVAAAFGF
jgi:hypothetical protein